MSYLALIGDIKESRKLVDRDAVQRRLQTTCDQLNRQADALQLVSPFTVTLGDEFQAVFTGAQHIWSCIFAIESGLHPVRVRFGMGVGGIDTQINRSQSIGMDGPAFHLAREAVTSLKSERGSYRVLGMQDSQQLALHTLDLVSHNRDSWNKNRVGIFAYMLSGVNVASMAKALGISEQAVYKSIRHGGLESIQGIFQGLSQQLDLQLGRD
jgi:predicted DNA-binding protein YlxM (UPF0122 family)